MRALASGPQARLYGSGPIERHLRQYGRSRQGGHSIADQPHEDTREIARRLRQAERNAERRLARAKTAVAHLPRGKVVALDDDSGAEFGLSRRGRWVPLSL